MQACGIKAFHVELTQGKRAVIDVEDAKRVIEAGPWCASKDAGDRYYVVRSVQEEDGSRHNQYLHRFILGVSDPNVIVDHISGNGLDNRKANLRLATAEENARNVRVETEGRSSRFRGVAWDAEKQAWRARIQVAGKARYLGRFPPDVRDGVDWGELAAAKAYDEAAVKYHGEFAALNKPLGDTL